MADDINEGLNTKLQAEINKMLEERTQLLRKQSKEYRSQLELNLQIQAALGAEQYDAALKRIQDMKEALNKVAEATEKARTTTEKMTKDSQKAAEKLNEKFGLNVKTLTTLQKKFPQLKSVGTAALFGLKQGLVNASNSMLSMVDLAGGLVSAFYNIGKALLSIPLNIFTNLLETAANFDGGQEIAQAFENIRKEFGSFKEDVAKNVITSVKNMRGELANTGLSTFRVFGNLAQRLDYVRETAAGMGATFHILGQNIAENIESFAAMQKGLGISAEDMEGVGRAAISLGKKAPAILTEIGNYSLQMGKAFGLSQKTIARDVGKMIKEGGIYAHASVKQLSEVTVYAKNLGVEYQKLAGIFDKTITFEGAAETASMLTQQFGAGVDAFQLMSAQTPTEKIEMLRKSMRAAGQDASNFNAQQLKLLASTTDLSPEIAKQVFSLHNQGKSLDEIQKASSKAEAQQLTMEQVTKKLSDSIERLVFQMMQLKGSFFDTFLQGFELGVKNSAPFMRMMMNLRNALMSTLEAGRQVGDAFVNAFPGVKAFIDGIGKAFDPKNFKAMLSGVVQSFKLFFSDKSPDSLKTLLARLKDDFLSFFGANSQDGKQIIEGAKTFFKVFAKIAAEGLRMVVEGVRDGLKYVADLLSGKKEFGIDASGAKTFAGEILEPLIAVFQDKELWKGLWSNLKAGLNAIWENAKTEYKSGGAFKDIADSIGIGLLSIAVAPAVINSLAALLINGVIKMFSAGFSSQTFTSSIAKVIGSTAIIGAAVGAVAVSVSNSLDKYDSVLSKRFGESEAKVASYGTGVVHALTLGLLPEDFEANMAETLAMLASKTFGLVEKYIGGTFARSLRDYLSASIKTIGGLGKFVKGIFTLNPQDIGVGALEFFRGLQDVVWKTLGLFVGFTTEVFTKFIDTFSDIFVRLANINLSDIWTQNGGTGMFKRLASSIGEAFASAWTTLKKKFFSLDSSFWAEALARFGAGIAQFATSFVATVVNMFVQVYKMLSNIPVIGKVFGFIGDKLDKVREYLLNISAEMKKAQGEIVEAGKTGAKSPTSAIFDAEKAKEDGKSAGEGAVKGIVESLKEKLPEIKNAVPTLDFSFGAFTNDPKAFVNKAQDALQSFESLKNIADKLEKGKIAEQVRTIVEKFATLDFGDVTKQMEKLSSLYGFSQSLSAFVQSASVLFKTASQLPKQDVLQSTFSSITNTIANASAVLGEINVSDITIKNIQRFGSSLEVIPDAYKSITSAVQAFSKDSMQKSLMVVNDSMAKIKELDDTLAGNANTLNIGQNLEKFVKSAGLGQSGKYTIENKGVTINLNLDVSMKASDVEEVLVLRESSIIRDGLSKTLGIQGMSKSLPPAKWK